MGMLKRIRRVVKGKLARQDWEAVVGEEESTEGEDGPTLDRRRWAFKVLEVEEGASKEEIRRAYRRLSRHYHPDKFSGQADKLKMANDLMSQINQAYALLTS